MSNATADITSLDSWSLTIALMAAFGGRAVNEIRKNTIALTVAGVEHTITWGPSGERINQYEGWGAWLLNGSVVRSIDDISCAVNA